MSRTVTPDRKQHPSLVTRAKRALWHHWLTGELPPRSTRWDDFPQKHPVLSFLAVAIVGLAFCYLVAVVLFAWWAQGVAP
jgi:hypothetical protein